MVAGDQSPQYYILHDLKKKLHKLRNMTFDETTTSTLIILIIIFTIILMAISLSILIINQLSSKREGPVQVDDEKLDTKVILQSGNKPTYYQSQPELRQKRVKLNRRSAESFNLYPNRHFNPYISRDHLNLIREVTLANCYRSNSSVVYYV